MEMCAAKHTMDLSVHVRSAKASRTKGERMASHLHHSQYGLGATVYFPDPPVTSMCDSPNQLSQPYNQAYHSKQLSVYSRLHVPALSLATLPA
jgi:hypothetical protein